MRAVGLSFDANQLDFFASQLPKKLGYAAQRAIWSVTLAVQQVGFHRVGEFFSVREQRLFYGSGSRPGGLAGRVTEWPSAKDGRFSSEITAGELSMATGSGGRAPSGPVLFSLWEFGGMREPSRRLSKTVPEPEPGVARPSKSQPIDPQFWFSRMKLAAYYKSNVRGARQAKVIKRTRHGVGGVGLFGEYGALITPDSVAGLQYKGQNGTFLMHSKKRSQWIVMQRTGEGRGPESRRPVWFLDPPYPIKAGLEWLQTTEIAARSLFHDAVDREISDVMAHEMVRGIA